MKTSLIIIGALSAVACGGGSQDYQVKSQEERLNDQLAMADEQVVKEDEHRNSIAESKGDSEEAEKFDKGNAEHEMKRASINAADCPNAIPVSDLKGYKPGELTGAVTFTMDGSVTEVKLDNYKDTPLGDCITRAYKSARVKQFVGVDETVEFKIELKEVTRKEDPKADKKKKK